MPVLIMGRSQKHMQKESRSTIQLRCVNLGLGDLSMPKAVTCCVLSTDTLKAFTNVENADRPSMIHQGVGTDNHPIEGFCERETPSSSYPNPVTMLRTFLECKEVKNIGCCYNLMSEEGVGESDSQYGFPVSKGVKAAALFLGKSSRDLACQGQPRMCRDMSRALTFREILLVWIKSAQTSHIFLMLIFLDNGRRLNHLLN